MKHSKNFQPNKFAIVFILIALLCNYSGVVLAAQRSSTAADFLCEIGRGLYQVGRYQEALHEFKKALIIDSQHQGALRYIKLLSPSETIPSKPKEPIKAKETIEPKEPIEVKEAVKPKESIKAKEVKATGQALKTKKSLKQIWPLPEREQAPEIAAKELTPQPAVLSVEPLPVPSLRPLTKVVRKPAQVAPQPVPEITIPEAISADMEKSKAMEEAIAMQESMNKIETIPQPPSKPSIKAVAKPVKVALSQIVPALPRQSIREISPVETLPEPVKIAPQPVPPVVPSQPVPEITIPEAIPADMEKSKAMEEAIAMQESMNKIKVAPAAPPQQIIETTPAETVLTILPKPIPPRVPGEIRLFINGNEAYINKPILLQDGQPLIPLKEISPRLYYTAVDLKGGKFKLISPQGETQEVMVGLVNQEPMLTQKQLKDYFSADTRYNPAEKALYINTKNAPKFQTYILEKPAAQLKQEKAAQDLGKKAAEPTVMPSYIPEAAMPSVDLHGNATYTYIKYHLAPPFHTMASSLSGRFYDYRLDYSGLWKDINGHMHHDYSYLNFTKPDLYFGLFDQYIDLYPLRMQSQDFTGLKVAKLWENGFDRTTFAGGNTETSASGQSASVEYEGQLYGLKHEFSPFAGLELQTAALYLENNAKQPELAGTTSMPRNNLVNFGAASLKLPYDFTVSAQLAHCLYNPDNDLEASVQDWDYRLATDLHKPRYNLGAAYEFIGDRYASVGNPVNYQDFKGWNFYGNYRVTDDWMFNGYASYYHDNVANDSNKPRTHNTAINLSSYHRFLNDHSANLSFTHFTANPAGVNAGASSNTDLYRIDYFLPLLKDMRMGLNYMFSKNSSDGAANSNAHTAGGTLFKGFGRGSSWFISQQFTKTIFKAQNDTYNATTSFNLNYAFTPWLTLYFNSAFSRDKAEESIPSSSFAGSSGFKYQIFPDTNFTLEYSLNSYNPKVEQRKWPKNWSLLFCLSQNFHVATPPNFGTVEGYVYPDGKSSGKNDAIQGGIEGVCLYLEDKREAITDSRGYYKFLYVAPGQHTVDLDLSNVPVELTSAISQKAAVVKGRKSSRVDFALVRSVAIKGKVFVDSNGDMIFQDNEEPLENIAITLEPGNHFTRADSEGNFKFEYLLPGKYTAKIRTEDVPQWYGLESKPEMTVDLIESKRATEINFAMKLLPGAEKKK